MPILVVCDGCQARYSLKDEHAGRKLKCKSCGEVLTAPELDDFPEERPDRGYDPAFDRDRFLLNQTRMSIHEKYYVYGEDDRPVLFIVRPSKLLRSLGAIFGAIFAAIFVAFLGAMAGVALDTNGQKGAAGVVMIVAILLAVVTVVAVAIRLSPKRHIYVYEDDSKQRLLLEIFQDQKVAIIRATYTVRDPVQGELGRFEKNYLYNLFRKKWTAAAPDGTPMVEAREDSLILSLLRRLLGPLFGFLRTNFVILRPGTYQVIGEFNRKMTLFDRYVLDLTADRNHELDRRMAIALGVLLDTGERR